MLNISPRYKKAEDEDIIVSACVKCKLEMVLVDPIKNKSRVLLEVEVVKLDKSITYQVEADLYECPSCGQKIYVNFGKDIIDLNSNPLGYVPNDHIKSWGNDEN